MKYLSLNRNIIISLVLLNMLSLSLSAQPANDIIIKKDIVYGHASGVDLKFDMAQPIEGTGPFPVIVFFHGGGWQAGDKSHGHHWIRMFINSGYVGVTVGYRFAPAFKWPSQVQDAKAAIRYLRANAASLNIDSDRIGVTGVSAGGYLALMLGMTDLADGLEGDGGSSGFSSQVQAVVSYFSASDFTIPRAKLSPEVEAEVMQYYKKPLNKVLADFIGSQNPDESILKRMSVITYVDKRDPPVQIFQGDADPFVSIEQAQRLGDVLKQAKVTHELILVKGGGHGWSGDLKDKTNRQMLEFFERELKQRK
jgi:acetyl esterase/lipase